MFAPNDLYVWQDLRTNTATLIRVVVTCFFSRYYTCSIYLSMAVNSLDTNVFYHTSNTNDDDKIKVATGQPKQTKIPTMTNV